jgi:hypothetical protein
MVTYINVDRRAIPPEDCHFFDVGTYLPDSFKAFVRCCQFLTLLRRRVSAIGGIAVVAALADKELEPRYFDRISFQCRC